MFRGTARAFATDAKARELTHHAVSAGFDRKLSPIMRMFLYLPLEHSENLNDQLESVRLTSSSSREITTPKFSSTRRSTWKYSGDLEGSQVETMPSEENPRRKK